MSQQQRRIVAKKESKGRKSENKRRKRERRCNLLEGNTPFTSVSLVLGLLFFGFCASLCFSFSLSLFLSVSLLHLDKKYSISWSLGWSPTVIEFEVSFSLRVHYIFSLWEEDPVVGLYIFSARLLSQDMFSLGISLSRQASQNKSSCRRHSLSLLLPFVLGDDSRRLLLFSCKDFSLYSKISKKHRITMRKRVSFLQEFFLSWCSCWTNTSIKGKHYICSSIFSSRIVSRFYRNQHHVVLCMTLTASSSCSVHGMKKKKDLHPHPSTDCLNEGRDAAAASRVALFPSTPCFADTRRDQDKKKCEETTKITSLPCPSSSYSSCVHREHFSSSSCLCSSKTRNSSREQELKRDRVLLFIWLRVPSQTSLISSLSFSLHLSLRVFNS